MPDAYINCDQRVINIFPSRSQDYRVAMQYLVMENPDGQMPLEWNAFKVEPHFRILSVLVDKFAEVFLHLKKRKAKRPSDLADTSVGELIMT